MNEERAKKVAEILLNAKAVTLDTKKGYRYASGILSPIYTDNRMLMGFVKERRVIIEEFINLIKEKKLEFDVAAGTATAGISWAAWIAEKLSKPMVYVRGKAKEHGKGKAVEGLIKKGQKVLVVEDLISSGGSSIDSINSLKEEGAEVVAVIAIFSYELKKAKENFAEAKTNYFYLTDFKALVGTAKEKKYLSEEEKNKVLEWNSNPDAWEKKAELK